MKLSAANLAAIKEYFSTQPVLRAYLFGSYARGEADADSDVDILVDLDYTQHIGLGFVQLKFDLEDITGHTIDLVSSKGVSPRILPFIEEDKLLIYARQAL